MTTQRLLIGTVVGGLVLFFLGYLIFGVLFASFFAANAGTATGVAKDPLNFVALGIAQLAWGAALTLILGWAGVKTIGQGATTAGIAGLLLFLGFDLTMYATSNTSNLTATLVDPILAAILFAVAGAAIVAASGKKT